MSFNEELEKTKLKKKEVKTRISWLKNDKQNLINSIATEIDNKYRKKEILLNNKLKKCNESIQLFCKEIEKYSVFNEYDIFKIFQELVTIYEGEDYIYQINAICVNYPGNYGYANILVLKELSTETCYQKEELDRLVKQGKALIFKYHNKPIHHNTISFYKVNKKGDLKQLFKFGKFKYLKAFLDMIISYKIDNKIDNISKEELYSLMINFIKLHLSEIEEKYTERSQEERQQMEEIIEDNKSHREKKLTKILEKK